MLKNYTYQNRTGNLTAEAVGVVKGEKHFPIFEGNMIFKPLTKSKPLSTPLFAYAEVFWSGVIDKYFMPVPRYQLAWCRGYEAVEEKYYDYTDIFEAAFFKENHDIAVQLAMYVLVAILKGDQNFHYENVSFLCDSSDYIKGLAPIIDHELSAYFMFPDDLRENVQWFGELQRSISGEPVGAEEKDTLQSRLRIINFG
jgi:hypothetical protein